MSAPNWEQGQGLTWSGRWHVFADDVTGKRMARTRCGAGAYTKDSVPSGVGRLQRIASGEKPAPVCKLCTKSADGPHVVVELIEDELKSFDEWHAETRGRFADDFNAEYMERRHEEHREYLDRFQPWRWIAKSAGNNEPLGKSTESYFNEDDCRHAISLLFGSGTPARLTVEYRDGRVKSGALR